jgi:alpha-tubulin suppressor-like RCC1 family protein
MSVDIDSKSASSTGIAGVFDPNQTISLIVNNFNKTAVLIEGVCPAGATSVSINGNVNRQAGCDTNKHFSITVDMSHIADGSYEVDVSFNTGEKAKVNVLVDTKDPIVKSVVSVSADGKYGMGDTLLLKVVFAETVILSGDLPELVLNTLPSVRKAIYQSGSGTSELYFSYSIQPGDMASLLNYADIASLDLKTADLRDHAGNTADPTLPMPGWGFSLGDISNIIVNGQPLGILNILGIAGGLDLSYDEFLIDGTAPNVLLSTLQSAKTYNVEIWSATMAAKVCGPYSSNLPSLSLAGCVLPEGIYRIVATAQNTLSSVAAMNSEFPFTFTTQILLATLSGVPSGTSNVSALNVNVGGSGVQEYKFKLGSGSEDCSNSAGYSGATSVTVPIASGLSGLSEGAVKLCVLAKGASPVWQPESMATQSTWTKDISPPSLTITTPPTNNTINASANSVSFGIAGSCSESAGAVQIEVDGSIAGAGGSCNGTNFAATLDTTLWSQGTHILRATMEDSAGNSGSSASVTVTKDTNSPLITSVSATDPDAVYSTANLTIVINFSRAVAVTGVPELELNILPSVRKATYIGGAGTTSLVFRYSVQTGDHSADLDATSINALSLAGGAIVDSVGNSASLLLPLAPNSLGSLKNIVIDALAPAIALTVPAHNSFINASNNSASFAVSGSCNEVGGTIQIKINGVDSGGLANCDGNSFSTSIDTTVLANATHNFVATFIDGAGNLTDSSTVTVIKSTTGPVISITAPGNNSFINGTTNSSTFMVAGQCSENGQLVTIKVDGGNSGAGANCIGTTFSATIDTTGLAPGTHALTASITDLAAATTISGAINVNKDIGAPTLTIVTPVDSSFINTANNSATFVVAGTCSEAGQTVGIKIDGVIAGGGATCDGTNFSALVESLSLSEGGHTLLATMSDLAGNSANSTTISVIKDTQAPTIGISSPVTNSFVNLSNDSAVFSVNGTCSINGQNVTIKVDGASAGAGATCAGNLFTATINTTGLVSGAHTLTATITDPAANTGTAPNIDLVKDVTAPLAAVTAPANSSFINSATDSVNFGVSGTCSEVSQLVTIKVDGVSTGTGATCDGSNFSAMIDTTSLAPGAHVVSSLVFDNAGNASVDAGNSVTKDLVAPSVAITNPTTSSYINSASDSVSFAVTGTCNEVGRTVNLKVDNAASGIGGVCDGTNFSATIDTTGLSEGNHTLVAELADASGNLTSSSSISMNKDTTVPTVVSYDSVELSGFYGSGVIQIVVTFSSDVTVSGVNSPELELNVTPTVRKALYQSGSGTSVLVFSYTVTAGDTATDLDAAAITALTITAGGFLRDVANNDANLTLPLPPNTLGFAKEIVIDTAAPDAPTGLSLLNPVSSPGTVSMPTIEVSGVAAGQSVKLFSNAGCTTQVGFATAVGVTVTITTSSGLTVGSHTFYANSTDPAGNASSCSGANVTYSYTGSATPPKLIVEHAYGFEEATIDFRVSLNEPTGSNVTFDWTATSDTADVSSDLAASSGAGAITVGNVETVISIAVPVDAISEYPEYFSLTISNVANATSYQSVARGLLYDPIKGITQLVGTGSNDGLKCGLFSGGSVKCWGSGWAGDGSFLSSHEAPVSVVGLNAGVTQIAYGQSSGCALQAGVVKCWGYNKDGQLGDGTTIDRAAPVTVALPSLAVQVDVGYRSTCALLDTQAVYCWGENSYNTLGQAVYTGIPSALPVPSVYGAGSGVIKVVSSNSASVRCVLLSGGTVNCWGYNWYGNIGDNTTTNRPLPVQPVGLASGVIDITLAEHRAYALMSDNTVMAWGYNNGGGLGLGTSSGSVLIPTVIPGLTAVAEIGSGNSFACSRHINGSLKCWGHGGHLGSGNASQPDVYTPLEVVGSGEVQKLAERSTCYLGMDSKPKCWGYNAGYHTLSDRKPHILNNYFQDIQALGHTAQATGNIDCDILAGNVWCYGKAFGNTYKTRPEKNFGTAAYYSEGTAVKVQAGYTHVCVLTSDGKVYCWASSGTYGQQGQGLGTAVDAFSQVSSLPPGIMDLSVGYYHSCAVVNDGRIFCWGYNNYGQLGNGSTLSVGDAVQVTGITNAVTVSAGPYQSCAVLADGAARCWGYNYNGNLGNGTRGNGTNSSVPVMPVGLDGTGVDVVDIQPGYFNVCARMADSTLRCWGSGAYFGQANQFYTTPVQPIAATNITEVIVADYTTCYLTTDSKVYCAGSNANYQIDQLTSASGVGYPFSEVSGLETDSITSIKAKGHSVCGLLTTGRAKCWGENYSDGSIAWASPRNVPAHRPPVLMLSIYPGQIAAYESQTLQVQLVSTEENSGNSSVTYATADGTAVAGLDYTGISGTANLAAGSNFVQLSDIPTFWHPVQENYGFLFNLTSLSGLLLARGQQPFTIYDAEYTGTYSWYGDTSPMPAGSCRYFYLYHVGYAYVPVPVSLSTLSPTGKFYSDSACTIESATTYLLGYGSEYSEFYFKDETPNPFLTLSAFSTLTGASVTLANYGPNKLIMTGMTDLTPNVCSDAIAISTNYNSALFNVTIDTTVNLTGNGTGAFYSDSSCNTLINSVTITKGSSAAPNVYFKTATLGSLLLTAASTGVATSGTLPVTVRAAIAATDLTIVGPAAVTANTCQNYFVALTDSQSNLAFAAVNTSFNFTETGLGTVYSDSSCTTSTQSLSFVAGTAYQKFYFKGIKAETFDFRGFTVPALKVWPFSVTVTNSRYPASIVWLGGAATAVTGACTALTLAPANLDSQPIAATSTILITLSSSEPIGVFYSNSSCVSSITSASILAGSISKIVYYKQTSPNTGVTLTASSTAPSATVTYQLSVVSPPTQLVVTGSATTNINECYPLSIVAKNAVPAPSNVASNTTVSLSATGSTLFYTNATCSTQTTTTILNAGTSTATVYFRNTQAESSTLTASAAGLLTSGNHIATSNSIKLLWGGATSVSLNTCTALTINSKNSDGTAYNVPSNLTVNISGSGAGSFYSASSCTGGNKINSGTITIASGSNTVNLWIKDNSNERLVLSAAATGYTTGSQSVTVGTPAALTPTVLTLTGTNPIPQGSCLAFTITTNDATGAAMNVPTNLTVTLAEVGNGSFYSNSQCTTATSSVVVASNSSLATVYFSDTYYVSGSFVDNVILTASAAGYSNGVYEGTLTAGAVSQLRWREELGIGSTVCVKMKLQAEDSMKNVTPFSLIGSTTVDLSSSGAGSGIFYSDNSCTTSVTSVQFGPAETSVEFYFQTPTKGTVLLTATQPGPGGATGSWTTEVVRAAEAVALSQSSETICLLSQGEVFCSGSNSDGALGVGDNLPHQGFSKVVGISTAVEIVGSDNAFCARLVDGSLKCWGYNGYSQLGIGNSTSQFVPVNVSGITSATRISGGDRNVCAVDGGAAKCWGYGFYKAIGDGTTTSRNQPTLVSGLSAGVTDISVGGKFTVCAVVNGGVQCWGQNDYGQLGDGTTVDSAVPVVVTALPVGSGVSRISVQAYQLDYTRICVIRAGGQMQCWGDNTFGALGVGGTYGLEFAAPTDFVGMETGTVGMDLNSNSSCAYNSSGKLLCAGGDSYGELGLVDPTSNSLSYWLTGQEPYQLNDQIKSMDSGSSSSGNGSGSRCVVLSSGRLKCWGPFKSWMGDVKFQLLSPTDIGVVTSASVTNVVASSNHACVVVTGGNLQCWGTNTYGQVGNGTATPVPTPTTIDVGVGLTVTSLAAYSNLTCAALSDLTAKCWGANNNGAVGNGIISVNEVTPTLVSNLTAVTEVAVGWHFGCAINNNQVWCWGLGTTGQLGNGVVSSTIPLQVTGLPAGTLSSLRLGYGFGCVLVDSDAWCWGENQYGQLGSGALSPYRETAGQVLGLPAGITKLAVGFGFSCAILTDSSTWCWGYNYWDSSVPLGAASTYATPFKMFSSGIIDLFASTDSSYQQFCAVRTDLTRICWGNNGSGSLGLGLLDYTEAHTFGGNNVIGFKNQIAPLGAITKISLTSTYQILLKDGVLYLAGANAGVFGAAKPTMIEVPSFTAPLR